MRGAIYPLPQYAFMTYEIQIKVLFQTFYAAMQI
jgi:hypothetical protein